MRNNGFILMYRRIKDWEWYDHPATRLIFEHCLNCANFVDEVWRGQKIKRGQFPTSIEKLAIANGLTTQQTRTALKNLQSTNEINIQTTNRYSIITVVNWDLYQPNQQTKSTNKKQTNNKQLNKQIGVSNNNTIINKEINKDISNIYNISSSSSKEFENFYKNLPEEDEENLKNYSLKNKVKYFRPWLRKLYLNGDIEDVKLKAKAYAERKKQKQAKNIPPPEVEKDDPEETKKILAKAKEIADKIRRSTK